MRETTTISKSVFKEFKDSYIDFVRLQPNESLKSYESTVTTSYLAIIDGSKSIEGFDAKQFIKTFVDKAIIFIGKIIKLILNIVVHIITFVRKLIAAAMDDSFMRTRSAYYEEHKQVIQANFLKNASKVYLPAIPPKNSFAFSSDNNIVLSIEQTINLLEELNVSFKKRVDLWNETNRQLNNRDSNTIFDQLYSRAETIKTHITDSILLAGIGIRIQYDLRVMALYDSQVKDYIINTVNKSQNNLGDMIKDSLDVIFGMPKRIIKIYLFGNDSIEEKLISVADFLRYTGVKEFDKLTYSDMSRIKANTVIVDGLLKKMDIIANKLEDSGNAFINSLRQNTSILYNIYSGGENEANNSLDIAQRWILPLLSFAGSFYSYFSNIIIEYSIFYCRHRKYLFDAARLLVERPETDNE